MKSIVLALLLLGTSLAHAVKESTLKVDFTANILPWFVKKAIRGNFKGVDGLNIEYVQVPAENPKGVIVISPGKSEPFMKYAEFIYDLQSLGYTIYAIDHRGQGFSGRMLADPEKSHVEFFQDYVDDFTYFVKNVVHPENYRLSFLLTHSMGGAIGSGFLAANPKAFTAAIISAPMMQVNTGFLTQEAATLLSGTIDKIFNGSDYAPHQHPYDIEAPFSTNTVTGSEARYKMNRELMAIYPELRIGGSTVRWVHESLVYTKKLRSTNNVYQIPTIMFQASKDQIVKPAGQNEICEIRSQGMCKLYRFAGAQHEIFQERDSIRSYAILMITKFIKSFEPK